MSMQPHVQPRLCSSRYGRWGCPCSTPFCSDFAGHLFALTSQRALLARRPSGGSRSRCAASCCCAAGCSWSRKLSLVEWLWHSSSALRS
eukprot:3087129-Prymnesium_polylepis.1